jgi:hypothetical protein
MKIGMKIQRNTHKSLKYFKGLFHSYKASYFLLHFLFSYSRDPAITKYKDPPPHSTDVQSDTMRSNWIHILIIYLHNVYKNNCSIHLQRNLLHPTYGDQIKYLTISSVMYTYLYKTDKKFIQAYRMHHSAQKAEGSTTSLLSISGYTK